MKKSNKPLNEKELRLLQSTQYDNMLAVFPGYTRRFLLREKKRALELFPIEVQVNYDAERMMAQAKAREIDRRYKEAMRRIESLEGALAFYKSAPEICPHVYQISTGAPDKREAAAVILASDFHCEETVLAEQVNGLNAFNLEVFEKRAKYFFVNSLKLLNKEAQSVEIRNLVLWLGGDFLTNSIHDDCTENNALGPMDAIALAQDTLAGGIDLLLSSTDKDLKLTVPTAVGNHGRTTPEQRVATEHQTSLEWLMYYNLAKRYEKDPRVQFIRNRSYLTYLDVLGYKLRLHHGHAIHYNAGVGGITIPVAKKIAQWNKGNPADLDCFGHFHNLSFGENFVCNGSLIGYNAYAISIGASFQRPQQAFFLIDSRWGKTVTAPILLEDV